MICIFIDFSKKILDLLGNMKYLKSYLDLLEIKTLSSKRSYELTVVQSTGLLTSVQKSSSQSLSSRSYRGYFASLYPPNLIEDIYICTATYQSQTVVPNWQTGGLKKSIGRLPLVVTATSETTATPKRLTRVFVNETLWVAVLRRVRPRSERGFL